MHTAPDPCWQVLNRWGVPRGSSPNVVADDKTVAECRTSSGRPFRVSLAAAPPPAISFISVDPAGNGGEDHEFADRHVYVVAAHGDSVLFYRSKVPQPSMQEYYQSYQPRNDYFVYKAAAGEPPSLSLLPTCLIPKIERDYQGYIHQSPTARMFDQNDTGILRRGKDELLVAQLNVANDAPFNTADLCMLRPGRSEWELKKTVPIVHHRNRGGHHDLQMWQDTNVAVPVGDRFLCWVNFDCSTFLVWDTKDEEDPKLRYVPLPVKAVPPKDDEDYEDCYNGQKRWNYYRSIAAVGPDAVRFVISIDNRCCCGAHIVKESVCVHSISTFMVTMWTLALRPCEPMAWVKECVLDCNEIWSLLTAGKGLQCVDLTCPVLSSENPDVVCFIACDEESLWSVEMDVRRKTLISTKLCPPHPQGRANYGNNLPAKRRSS